MKMKNTFLFSIIYSKKPNLSKGFFRISNLLLVLSLINIFTFPILAQPYPEPTSDISWSAGTNGVADIKAAFENARAEENSQVLSPTDPPDISTTLVMPSQSVWDGMSNSEKALYLVNAERTARGLLPIQGVSSNIVTISQNYAQYLLDNNVWGHNENGSPFDRLNSDPLISAHQEGEGENIYVAVSSANNIKLPVEDAVYGWIYDDSGSAWGHRNGCFYAYNNNFGSPANEGLIGLGVASGGPYQGPFSSSWNYAVLVVYDFVDPTSASVLTVQPIELTALLEGPYNTTNHNMDNNITGSIPLSSPFTEDPETAASIPATAVDWVLVQLRDKNNSSTIVASKSAFLLKDGSVVDIDGSSPVQFSSLGDNYFVSIKHKNHLKIMSAAAVSLSP